MAFRSACASYLSTMEQASNIPAYGAILRRAAQILVVMGALAVMVFASCMMVTADDKLTVVHEIDQSHGTPSPGPTAPEPPPA